MLIKKLAKILVIMKAMKKWINSYKYYVIMYIYNVTI